MPKYSWWQKGIIYQIYPRSFQDSNGDGIGDLSGISQRLDYLQSLNIEAIWLSPIYPSPMHDFGYDVADYTDIHPLFGTMADFDALLVQVHAQEMKLILDLVPNHTSDEHPWFVESRSSRDSAKRDWYLWRDPAPDGGPPNNWLSRFGGPAWTWDEKTGQYYLHQFVQQQPELDFRNPEVKAAMLDVMRFWLDKGVDGFRVDVIWLMMKDPELRDEPLNPDWDGIDPNGRHLRRYSENLPENHELVREMRSVMDAYEDRVMIGEIYLPNEGLIAYYGNDDECHLPFNFQLIQTAWQKDEIQQVVEMYEADLGDKGWPNWVLGNHDQWRIASRAGLEQARAAQMLLLTLRGTPTCYYGDEIGMENVPIPAHKIQDPPALNLPEIADKVGRDPERTPMQWDRLPHAGFTAAAAEPWLPVAHNYQERNVAVQEADPTSLLHLFRRLTALRNAEPALHAGSYQAVTGNLPGDIYAYQRSHAGADSFLVVLNLGGQAHVVDLGHAAAAAEIAVSSDMVRSGSVDLAHLQLGPNEGLLLRLL